jgi:ABC-type dipeptide/oligopeptide/nickel transport system permease subunit
MSSSTAPLTGTQAAQRGRLRSMRSAFGGQPAVFWVTSAVILFYVLVAIFGPLLIHYNPINTPLLDRLKPPGSHVQGGGLALLGTDGTGRDILAQLIYGARTSVTIGVLTVSICCVVGVTIGVLAGFFGGLVDAILSRIIDVLLAFPGIVLAIVVAGLFTRSIWVVVIALALTGWISFARLSRSSALSIRRREWVEAARVLGVRPLSIMFRHVLPFVIGPVGALLTIEFGLIVLAEAGLSFLGIGLPSTTVSWGQTIAAGKEYLATAWWISAFPGITLAVLLLMVGLLGDHLNSRYQRGATR